MLISQGGRRYIPYVFTEQGVAILSSVLNSKRAVQVDIEIMRTFVRLRKILLSDKGLSHRLDKLEKKYDTQFKIVFDAIRQLMARKQNQNTFCIINIMPNWIKIMNDMEYTP